MTPRYCAVLCCIALGSCSGACQPSAPQQQESEHTQTTGASSSAALRDANSKVVPPSEASRQARVDELTASLIQARTQRQQLTLDQSVVSAQLASHQADSTATLDKLKAEMAALQSREAHAATRGASPNRATGEAFSERARNQLEHSLAMDQEFQTQLAQLNSELQLLDTNIATMQAELHSLQPDK